MRTLPALLCLALAGAAVHAARAPKPHAVAFQKITVDPAFRSEGVAVADFNRDGKLDIATGNTLYLGPDFKKMVPMLAEAKTYDPKQYSDAFLCFAEDVDRDGWTDAICVGFPGQQTYWLKNPGKAGGPWQRFLAVAHTGNESPTWTDVDGDGRKELVFMAGQGLAFAQPGEDPTQPWNVRVIAAPGDPKPGHGLGVGDVNKDGRLDVLIPQGWWEQPADPKQTPWPFHAAKLSDDCAQLCVYDVNGDGRPDVVSTSAHRYGVWWTEQLADGWQMHEIDKTVSQTHAVELADLNGDGVLDLITGKRYYAHTTDPGAEEPSKLCWYELQRKAGQVTWVKHEIDNDSGVGLHFQVVDLNGDGRPDIVTSNKRGVNVFLQKK